MTGEQARFRRADRIVDEALDLPQAERREFLDRACGDDRMLRSRVERLLQVHGEEDTFLSTPATALGAFLLTDAFASGPIPGRVGPFRLVRELGQGGMGTVYLGERDDGQFQQRAAIKLIRPSRAGEDGMRRFLVERRILARLEHPRIARLLEGGVSDDGRPYFAMEVVEGDPLDRYCDTRILPIERRLELFQAVCEAVQYAHQRLVVHRDLKPSNILVTPDSQVKLLDFGIAKLVDQVDEAGHDPVTQTGALPMTPDYAAPEQVRGEPVSTATDIYALGVVLYLLLTGRQPHQVRGKPPKEILQTICEVDPPRPSQVTGEGPDAPDRARARGTTPERLRRRLKGDLDLIVLKAMHKDPARRYESVAALADDLRRFARGWPVLARPDRAGYHLRKFVGRHRGGVVATGVLAALLVGFGVRERALRAQAEAEARKARAVQDYLVDVFDVADPFAPPELRSGEVTARALLDRGAARIDTVLAGHVAEQAELRGVFGRVYSNLGLYEPATRQLEQSLVQRRALYGSRHPAVAEAMAQLGQLLVTRGRLDSAEVLLRGALEQRRILLGHQHPTTAVSLDDLAWLLRERNDFEGAERMLREALAIRRRHFGPDDATVAQSLNNVALLNYWKGAYDAAEPLYRQAGAIWAARLGEDHPQTAQAVQNLAQVQQLRGHLEEAEALFRRALAAKRLALGDAHPSVTISLNNLANLVGREMGKLDEAEVLVREALALDRQMFGDRHANVAASLDNLATLLRLRGEFNAAEATYREALAVNRAVYGEEHNSLALNLNNIAQVRLLQGDTRGAVELFRESHARYTRLLGAAHPFTQTVGINLARALHERGDQAASERQAREILSRLDTANVQHRPRVIGAATVLGQALTAQGRLEEAQPLLEQVLARSLEYFGPGDLRTGQAGLALGQALLAAGDFAGARRIILTAQTAIGRHSRAQPRLAAQAARAAEQVTREAP